MTQTLGYAKELGALYQRMRDSFRSSPFVRGPVRLGVLRCSDGRMRRFNGAIGAKPGMFFDMRAVGARKDFISYPFRDRLGDWLRQGGEEHAFLLTYHFDCLELTLGCKGHHFDKDAAIKAQMQLAADLEDGFRGRIRPLVVGFDTRLEELVLHGQGSPIRARELGDRGQATMMLHDLWPHVPHTVRDEIIPLLLHNAAQE